MSDFKISIQDLDRLEELVSRLNSLESSLDSAVESTSNSYHNSLEVINAKIDSLSSDLNAASSDFESAYNTLSVAQNSYNSCISQPPTITTVVDEEGNEHDETSAPDCSGETSNVLSAELNYNEAKEKYDVAASRYSTAIELMSGFHDSVNDLLINIQTQRNKILENASSASSNVRLIKHELEDLKHTLSQIENISDRKAAYEKTSNSIFWGSYKNKQSSSFFITKDDQKKIEKKNRCTIIANSKNGKIGEENAYEWLKQNKIMQQVQIYDVYFDDNNQIIDELEIKTRVDFYIEEYGEIWEIKTGYKTDKVKPLQIEALQKVLEHGYFYRANKLDNKEYKVESVNYLFDNKEGLIYNLGKSNNSINDLNGRGFFLWYIDENGEPQNYDV